MSSNLFAAVEAALVIVAVFGLAIWQLASVRRSIKRDRQSADRRGSPEP